MQADAGIKGKFKLVAMRDIKAGEQVLWDYDMTEDSDWVMVCKCGNDNCRKIIKGFRFLPDNFRQTYKGYISKWLVHKYKL